MVSMNFLRKKDRLILLVGDAILLYISLYIALFLRYLSLPTLETYIQHAVPFTYIFLVWIIVFVILGLYEKRTTVEQKKVHGKMVKAHIVNSAIAIAFFYFVAVFEIAPKTLLFVFLAVSLLALWLWRWYSYRVSGEMRGVLIIGEGKEVDELAAELTHSKRFGTNVVTLLKPSEVTANKLSMVFSRSANPQMPLIKLGIIDFRHENVVKNLDTLYDHLFKGVEYVDIRLMYEDVFDRIPLSLIDQAWFIRHVSSKGSYFYDDVKRSLDVILALLLYPIYLLSIPFVLGLIKLEEAIKKQNNGPIFINQERIGRGNRTIFIPKFRTMTVNDKGKWVDRNGDDRLTKVGIFLRKSRIDELPQVKSVLRGDLSFVGPRPDLVNNSVFLKEQIPYYSMRNVITPGLSGWAQIKQDYAPQTLEETRLRLAYDFHYIKNRSLFLDLIIALRTIRTLLSRVGI